MLVKYVRNAEPQNGTTGIQLSGNRVLVCGGDALEITDDEFRMLQGRYVLEEVGVPATVLDVSAPTAPSAPSVSSPSPSTPGASGPTTSTPTSGN